MNVSSLMVLIFAVLAVAGIYFLLPKDNAARRKLAIPSFTPPPRPMPITQMRVPTLTDKVKAQLLRLSNAKHGPCTAKSMLKMLRDRGDVTGPMKVRTIQVILNQLALAGSIKRKRPSVRSPRLRRNGTMYQLAAA